MGADPVAAMIPAIAEVLEASRGGETWCATFEVSGDAACWIQVMRDTLNLPYPPLEPPAQVLAAQGHAELARLEVRDWKAHEFAMFEAPAGATAADLARLADALLRAILGCADAYPVSATVEKLDDAG